LQNVLIILTYLKPLGEIEDSDNFLRVAATSITNAAMETGQMVGQGPNNLQEATIVNF
jgi:hypothetical protein